MGSRWWYAEKSCFHKQARAAECTPYNAPQTLLQEAAASVPTAAPEQMNLDVFICKSGIIVSIIP